MQVVKNDLLQLLVDLLLFPQYDVPLPFDSGRVKLGVLEDVTDNVDSRGDIFLEALGVVYGLFPRRVSVKVGTNILNLKFESVLGTTAGALESHMLEEVSGSVRDIGLRPGTRVYPDTDRSGLSVRMRLCSDGKAI